MELILWKGFQIGNNISLNWIPNRSINFQMLTHVLHYNVCRRLLPQLCIVRVVSYFQKSLNLFIGQSLYQQNLIIFGWMVSMNRIPSKTALIIRNINSSSCTLCGYHKESADHILIKCHLANTIWCKLHSFTMFRASLLFNLPETWPLNPASRNIIRDIFLNSF